MNKENIKTLEALYLSYLEQDQKVADFKAINIDGKSLIEISALKVERDLCYLKCERLLKTYEYHLRNGFLATH